MEFHIKEFSVDYTEELVELWQTCGLAVPWNDLHEDIAMKLRFQPNLLFIALDATTLIGSVMAGYEGHRGVINYLAVDPKYQRKGIGQRIMDFAEKKLRGLGCIKINLQVRETNTGVIRFYEKIGYKNDNLITLGKRIG